MKTKRNSIALLAITLCVSAVAAAALSAAQDSQKSPDPPAAAQTGNQGGTQDGGMSDMPGMDMGEMQKDTARNPDAARDATKGMSDRDMDMGAHMFMTDLRLEQPGDEQRAKEIVDALRPAIAKYKDYHAALADGFQIFLPNLPQPQYHFTNYRNAFVAQFKFDPTRPTSLLYKKTADGYELVGAMYTAPRRDSEDQLNERVPLSVARWHKHVNFCLPPKACRRSRSTGRSSVPDR